jgi:hypothetical protein
MLSGSGFTKGIGFGSSWRFSELGASARTNRQESTARRQRVERDQSDDMILH